MSNEFKTFSSTYVGAAFASFEGDNGSDRHVSEVHKIEVLRPFNLCAGLENNEMDWFGVLYKLVTSTALASR